MKSKVISIINLKKTYFSDLKGKSFLIFFLNFIFPEFFCNIFNIKFPQKKHSLSIKKLDIFRGEIIGVIGNNGAGKSTLLKVLSGITSIDSGVIKINGNVFPILELGAGFSDDLSGKENIFMLGSFYGFSHQFIKDKLSEIIKFSSLGNFIDHPYNHYSSGMKARLAFSFAVSMSFDILLIDEALAVGDMEFQSKAMARLNALNKQGVTIIIVSHDINSLRNMASKIIWLDSGNLKLFSNSEKVSTAYLFERAKIINDNNINHLSNIKIKDNKIDNRYGSFELSFYLIELFDNNNQNVTDLIYDQNYRLSLTVKCKKNISNIIFGFSVNDMYGNQIFVSQSKVITKKFIDGKFYKINIDFKNILLEGRYYLSVAIEKPILKFKKHYSIDVIPQFFFFKSHLKSHLVKKSSGGYVYLNADYSILDYEKQ